MLSRLYIFALALLILACARRGEEGVCFIPHEIGTIEIYQRPDNSLRVGIDVQTNPGKDVYVTYWEKCDSRLECNDKKYYSDLSSADTLHHLVLVVLKPATTYEFQVVVQDELCKTLSSTYEFTTNLLSPWVPYFPKPDSMKQVSFSGYVAFQARKDQGYLLMIDDTGELVWYQKAPMNVKVSKYTWKNTFLSILSDDTLRFSSGNHIAEVGLDGNVLFEVEKGEGAFNKTVHHEIDFDENGNIMSLTYEQEVVDLSSVGGGKQDIVRGDGILIYDPVKNEKVWEWSVFDVFSPLDYANILNERGDWLHANALVKDTLGNYLISFRNCSQIWKIDGVTGALIWRLGRGSEDLFLPEDFLFNGQHNIHFDTEGYLVILDNGNRHAQPGVRNANPDYPARSKPVSRMLTLHIDEETRKVDVVGEVVFPEVYMTESQGSAGRISDELVLFNSSTKNILSFVNSKGENLGSLLLEYPSYRAQYIPDLNHSKAYVNKFIEE
ncbi:aryl-sulfate sulfotransferase [Marinoscillum sp. 108]|uniref:aryl-sulfate sulfotransferase n=1 Tax=Marinoscillum sp. 108 TaxID=2653151 RepID=UPI0012EF1CB4|nr:aryl-sulfate sulfotransferase [Marinoscillum sp. 108]VXD14364.1 conserved hypothetical protein [Marinoscillum sp. 108]